MPDTETIIQINEHERAPKSSTLWLAHSILALLCLPLFFIGLGNPPLIDPDEPVYAAAGRAMLQSGTFAGWWSPHYDGALWFDKPPMTYWLIGLSMRFFGQTALAARLPSAVCAVILIGVTIFFTKRLWPKSGFASLWAGLVAATSLQTVILARAAVTDMILAAFLTFAIAALWIWLVDERQVGWLLAAGLATGMATLTKGPVAIVLVGGTVLFYLLLTRQAQRLRSGILWLSLLISIAVALPWYLSMIKEHGSLFVQGFLEANNLTRYLSAEHPQTSSWFWFLPVLLGFIFPWTVPLIFSLSAGWSAFRSGDRSSLYVLTWIAWVFVFFSASQTKLLTYIYPLYPMAACLIGFWASNSPPRRQLLISGAVFVVIAMLLAVALPTYVGRGQGLSSAKPALEQIGVVFAISAVAVIILMLPYWERRTASASPILLVPAISMAAFFACAALSTIWHQDLPSVSMVSIGRYIGSHTSKSVPTVALSLKKPSLVYYSSREFIFVDDRKVAAKVMLQPPYPLCLTKIRPNEDVVGEVEKYIPGGRNKIVTHSFLKYVLIKYQP